jgi:hypothetical protein
MLILLLLLSIIVVISTILLIHAASRLPHLVIPLAAFATRMEVYWGLLVILVNNRRQAGRFTQDLPLVQIFGWVIGLQTFLEKDMAQEIAQFIRNFLAIEALVDGLILIHGISRQKL